MPKENEVALTLSKTEATPVVQTYIEASAPATKKPVTKKVQAGSKQESKVKLNGTAADILTAIRKTKGDKVVVMGNEAVAVARIPTGIFELDFYLGGGFPCGRYTIIYGPESSNKTNIALLAVAEAQRRPAPNNLGVWVDVEQVWDKDMAAWAEKLGVNTANLMVVKPAYGEEAVDMVDALMRAEDVAILVVDSLAPMIAVKEIEQSAENFDVGTSALMIKRMANKVACAFGEERRRDHYPCVIFINQIRFKIGVLFGNPETMPGGEAVKFLASMRLRTSASNKVVTAINPDVHSFKETHIILKKAKVPVLSNDFKFDLCVYDHDKLKCGESASWNMVMGYLQQLGSMVKVPKGYQIAGEMVQPIAVKGQPQEKPYPQTWKTQADIADQYYSDRPFRMRMQKLVIDAFSDKTFYVDEPTVGPQDIVPGIKVDMETGEILEENEDGGSTGTA
jgi:recombination protein RecA